MATDAELLAVYNRREDIRNMYAQYPEWQGADPVEIMKNWLPHAATSGDQDALRLLASSNGGGGGSEVAGGFAWYQLAYEAAKAAADDAFRWAQFNNLTEQQTREYMLAAVQQAFDQFMGLEQLGLAQQGQEFEHLLSQQQLSGYMDPGGFGIPTFSREQWLASETGYITLPDGTVIPTMTRERWLASLQQQAAAAAAAAEQRAWQRMMEEKRFGLEEAGQAGQLGLGYLDLLQSQRGPVDWLSYWNTVRAAEQTELPTYLRALAGQYNLPAFQEAQYRPPAVQGTPVITTPATTTPITPTTPTGGGGGGGTTPTGGGGTTTTTPATTTPITPSDADYERWASELYNARKAALGPDKVMAEVMPSREEIDHWRKTGELYMPKSTTTTPAPKGTTGPGTSVPTTMPAGPLRPTSPQESPIAPGFRPTPEPTRPWPEPEVLLSQQPSTTVPATGTTWTPIDTSNPLQPPGAGSTWQQERQPLSFVGDFEKIPLYNQTGLTPEEIAWTLIDTSNPFWSPVYNQTGLTPGEIAWTLIDTSNPLQPPTPATTTPITPSEPWMTSWSPVYNQTGLTPAGGGQARAPEGKDVRALAQAQIQAPGGERVHYLLENTNPAPGPATWATKVTPWGGRTAWDLPFIQPHKVTARQWNTLLPSEQMGLQGVVEEQGAYWPDWLAQMQRSWPVGQAGRKTWWR